MFQDDSSAGSNARTRLCPHCGLYVPVTAVKCYKCTEKIDRHSSRWAFLSSSTFTASLGGMTGLAAALTLLFTVVTTFYDKHGYRSDSSTTVAITQINPEQAQIDVDVDNTGQKFSELQRFTLEVTTLNGESPVLVYSEQLALDSGSVLSIGHTEHSESHRLVPSGPQRQWNLSDSVTKAQSRLTSEERARLRIQMLNDASPIPYTQNCLVRYFVKESASAKYAELPISQGSDQWTKTTCKRFLQTAYRLR